MGVCIICQIVLEEKGTVLTLKGCKKINDVSSEINANIVANIGDKVHENCRRAFVSQNNLKSLASSTQDLNNNSFNLDTSCIFCGEITKINEKKPNPSVVAVVTSEDFYQSIKNALAKRNDDEWAQQVSNRISVSGKIGVRAVYHNNCRIGFRTNKPMSKSKKSKKSTHSTFDYKKGFLDIVNLIQAKNQAQYSIKELIEEMNAFSDGNSYSFIQMQTNLVKYFGDEIVISTFQNKKTLVTLRSTSYEILNDFYESSQNDNESRKVIILKSSEIIFNDIKKVTPNKGFYPSSSDISLCEAQKFLPESLLLHLSHIITGHNSLLKIVAIGQAIVQTAHRENVMSPLQIALATQMHYFTGSKFVVNTLNAFGFCSTYGEARKYQMCASIALHEQRKQMPNESAVVVKYVADNVDHNLRTLDGKNTFHGMGIISIHRPIKQTRSKIPRVKIDLQDIKEIGAVEILPYFIKVNTSLFYRKLNANVTQDPYSDLDLLWKMSWTDSTARPGWSGMMQLVQQGSYPEKATVHFLPIIDMNPTDVTCIFSTLHFICKDAAKFNATSSATFDQPLWWKARTIVENESVNSPLKRMVLCLGGFHTKMSFLGTIGHIMSGSGFDVTLAQVYAENTVPHMMSGKAYARAIRGFFMVDSALNTIIFEDILNGELSPKVFDLLKTTIDGRQDIDKIHENEVFKQIKFSFLNKKESLKSDSNSRLWLLYMDMIDTLKSNIRADRIGILY